MRTLLEKAIVHLLNGDETKAAALFHKFMVERARQIHESLRQDDTDETLDENWDSEITEEEYFGDDDLADAEPASDETMGAAPEGDMPEMGDDVDAPIEGDAEMEAGDDIDAGDDFGGDDFGADSEPGVEGKIDELSDKIDELTAEFDRMMSEFHTDGDMDTDMDVPTDSEPSDMPPADDFGGDEPEAEGDDDDLADRMEDDMQDDEHAPDHEPVAEGEKPDFLKKDEDCDEDDLKDITESVLAELEKLAKPSNAEGKGVGSVSAPSNVTHNHVSPVPHNNVMNRGMKGEPVMTKGPTHDGYARETAPTVKPSTTLVKDVRKGNRRNSFKDTMGHVPPKGDASAELNKDFAGGPKPTKSIVDGKTSKG